MVRESECCCDNRRQCVGRKEKGKEGDRKSVCERKKEIERVREREREREREKKKLCF